MSPVPSNDNSKPPIITQQTVMTVLRILLGMIATTTIGAKYPQLVSYITDNLPVIVPAVTALGVFLYGTWRALRPNQINATANLKGATVVLDSHAEAASINNASVVPAPAVVVDDKKAA